MFGERLTRTIPNPAVITPTKITFRGPTLSTRKPTTGDKNPDSTWRRENAPDNIVRDTPKSLIMGRKKTVKPCQIATERYEFSRTLAPTMYQP
jgi:hypothetical protein